MGVAIHVFVGVASLLVGAASAAIPRQRATPRQAPIAAEAAPTVTLTLMLTDRHWDSGSQDCKRCSPINPPQCSEEPAGTTPGPGTRRRGQRVEKARRGPARDGRPFPLRQEVESETSTRSPTRPEGQSINGRSSRPFLSGSPQAWPRGWYPPALAKPRGEQNAMPKASPPTSNAKKSRQEAGFSGSHTEGGVSFCSAIRFSR